SKVRGGWNACLRSPRVLARINDCGSRLDVRPVGASRSSIGADLAVVGSMGRWARAASPADGERQPRSGEDVLPRPADGGADAARRQHDGTRANEPPARALLAIPRRGAQARPPLPPCPRGQSRPRPVRAVEPRNLSGSGRKAAVVSRVVLYLRGRP